MSTRSYWDTHFAVRYWVNTHVLHLCHTHLVSCGEMVELKSPPMISISFRWTLMEVRNSGSVSLKNFLWLQSHHFLYRARRCKLCGSTVVVLLFQIFAGIPR